MRAATRALAPARQVAITGHQRSARLILLDAHRQLSITSRRLAELPPATPPRATAVAPIEPIPAVVPPAVAGTPPPPPVKPRKSFYRRYVVRTARFVLFVVVGGAAYIAYDQYTQRHPPDQLEHDPSKPTVVVLGSGWASTSFLKDVDTSEFNVIVISPRNYFLFSPLLPSVTVGTLEPRSIIEPSRFITRHKSRRVEVIEAEAETVDPVNKTVTVVDSSDVKGEVSRSTINYDYLIYGVGAENATFGIPGVREHACFLKELWDADKLRRSLMDCIETATFKGQSDAEVDRLLHAVVVGGGPTGVEYAAELHDFLAEDLSQWYPEISGRIKITLIEALPNVLPMFSKQLIEYATNTMSSNKIEIRTKTMVKSVGEKALTVQNPDGTKEEVPYGLLVWATGNTARDVTRKLMASIGEAQNVKRGLVVDEYLRLKGADGIYAFGDCTATQYSWTAQTAQQQGRYLARVFTTLGKKNVLEAELEHAQKTDAKNKDRIDELTRARNKASVITPFEYTHQGSLAYVGSDRAIGDFSFGKGNVAAAGMATYMVWRSAYGAYQDLSPVSRTQCPSSSV